MKRVAVIGEGAWGTAVATLLARNGHDVKLWCYHTQVAKQINTDRCNKMFLGSIVLDVAVHATTNMKKALCGAEWVFEAIPVPFLRSVLDVARECFEPQQKWVVLSKGIEHTTLMLPGDIIADVLDDAVKKTVLAGPSFALDVAKKQITAVTIAAPDCELGTELQQLLANDYFRPYLTTDMVGVQVGSALKNVIALGVGMLDGAGYTDNTKAFLLTCGLHEMGILARALGGKVETVYGLSGVGDLVLTAMGTLSRNLEVGRMLGRGKRLSDIQIQSMPEGINTAQSVGQLIEKHGLDLPICRGIYEIIEGRKTVHEMMQVLVHQPLSWECEMKRSAA